MKQHTHIGVYALAKKGNSVLFIEKSRGPYTGKWDLPGGSFEFGESPEETGHTVLRHQLLNVLSHTVTYKKANGEKETVHHIGILYSVEIDSNSEKLKDFSDGEDSLGAKWLSISYINESDFSPFASQSKQYINEQLKVP